MEDKKNCNGLKYSRALRVLGLLLFIAGGLTLILHTSYYLVVNVIQDKYDWHTQNLLGYVLFAGGGLLTWILSNVIANIADDIHKISEK